MPINASPQQMRVVSSFDRGAAVPVFEEEERKEELLFSDEKAGNMSVRRELFKLGSESESE